VNGKLKKKKLTSIKPSGEIAKCIGGVFLLSELDVDIADHMVSQVVTDVQALHLAVLTELLKQVFVEFLNIPWQALETIT
jgi:hypothetical protein